MAKKNEASFTVTFNLDEIAGLSAAERKNFVENEFALKKEEALDDLTKRLS